MKFVGILLIGAAAVWFSFEQVKRERERLLLLEELYRFIECIRSEITCYLRPISEIPANFSSELLCECGFLCDAVNLGLNKAYIRLEEKFNLKNEEKKLLGRFFSLVGRGYAADEIKLSESVGEELLRIIGRERADAPKRKKLVVTLSGAAAFALIILLI